MKVFNRSRWPRSLTIEVEHDDFLKGKRDPLLPVKNELYKTVRRRGKPVKIVTPRHNHFRRLIQAVTTGLNASAWPYRLTVEQRVQRRRKVAECWFPGMDNDACLAGIHDAIEHAGLLLNDAQIVQDSVSTMIAERYSLRIELEAWPQWLETNA